MRYLFLIGLLSFSTLFVKAQDNPGGQTHEFNLQQCLDYAYANQDSMKNARLDIESANYKVKETIGIGLPQVSGSAALQDYLKIPTTLLPGEFFNQPGTFIPVKFGVKYQANAGLSVSQLLFNGTYLVGLKASKTYKELSQRAFNRTKIETEIAVTKAYYQVLVNGEQLKLIDANLNQLKKQLNETTALNEQGFVEKIDLSRIQVLYNNLSTTRENTVRLLALGYQLLKFQMGMPVADNLKLTDKIEDIKLETDLSVEPDTTAYRKRIEYGLLETQKKLNQLDLQRIKSEALPSLAAFGSGSYNFQSDQFSNLLDEKFPTVVVGLQLNVPIFSGFQRLNQVRQAKIAVQKSENMLNTVKNGLQLQQEQARVMYTNGIQSLNNQKSNMSLAEEVLRVSRIKYEQGVGSSLEVTQAQTALEEAQNNYIQALYDALISKVDLDRAYGRIQ
ncbi:TolC family protein [Rubrolithibacter danxiaensis]|uniref:TolC family protein n=1 Tax=Rubrolithibacter danxiaensis TaxID=3390805 RepID=UPI003BF89679